MRDHWISAVAASSRQKKNLHRDPASAFESKQPKRRLRVVLDTDSLEDSDPRVGFLIGLLDHELIDLYQYSHGGPPADLATSDKGHVQGWLTIGPPSQVGTITTAGIMWADDRHAVSSSVTGELVHLASATWEQSQYAHLGQEAAVRHIVPDVLLLKAVDQLGADALVSGRSYILDDSQYWSSIRAARLSGDEAVAVVSLYLRSFDHYYLEVDGNWTYQTGRRLLYWVAARNLLDAAWRWRAAAVQHSRSEGDHRGEYLTASTIQRVSKALRIRDRLLMSLCQTQSWATQDEIAEAIEDLALSLMGAFDTAAAVADLALGLGSSPFDIGWQRGPWIGKVRAKASSLADLMSPGVEGRAVLDVVRHLRNTIHGETLNHLTVSATLDPEATLIEMPRSQADQIERSVDLLGGSERFGLRRLLPERVHAIPELLSDQLLRHSISVLNRIMKETPVERLPGVNLQPSDLAAPTTDEIWSKDFAQRIDWQLGLT